jgi:hypothetical protein
MEFRIQLVAIVGAVLLLFVVLELVRRRRLLERYALLWLLSGLVLLGLALWRGLLEEISTAIGVVYPPNALFFVAFAFILVLLLHFSVAVSRLSDQSKVLAQRLALLEERVRRQEGQEAPAAIREVGNGSSAGELPQGELPEGEDVFEPASRR